METKNLTEAKFQMYLKNYLFSIMGAKFRKNFKFGGTLDCRNEMAPPIIVSDTAIELIDSNSLTMNSL